MALGDVGHGQGARLGPCETSAVGSRNREVISGLFLKRHSRNQRGLQELRFSVHKSARKARMSDGQTLRRPAVENASWRMLPACICLEFRKLEAYATWPGIRIILR
jgi:hypothetical protein